MPSLDLTHRNLEVDAIRTAALVGICVVNVPFMGMLLPEVLTKPDTGIDQTAMFAVAALFQGKFFILFSFIFGWGIAIQQLSAEKSCVSFKARYFRRLIGLAFIGVAHAFLVFAGDILVLYAILGAAMFLLRNTTPRRLIFVAAACIPLAAASMALIALALGDTAAISDAAANLGGTYAQTTAARISSWPATFAFVFLFNGPIAFGAFALGLAAARAGFFEPGNSRFELLSAYVPILTLTGIVLNLIYGAQFVGFLFPKGTGGAMAVSTLLSIGAPCLSAVYLVAIVRFVRRLELHPRWLAAGRNSLSTYVAQGVLAGLVFGGYGLGWFGEMGHARLLLVSLTISLLTIVLAAAIYGTSTRGPLESLLRLLTYGRRLA